MKITRAELKQLIKEELEQALDEKKSVSFDSLVRQLKKVKTNNPSGTEKVVAHIEQYISEFDKSASRLRGLKNSLETLNDSFTGNDLGTEEALDGLGIKDFDHIDDIFPEEMMEIVENILEMMDDVVRKMLL
jgi:hypothetical protein